MYDVRVSFLVYNRRYSKEEEKKIRKEKKGSAKAKRKKFCFIVVNEKKSQNNISFLRGEHRKTLFVYRGGRECVCAF